MSDEIFDTKSQRQKERERKGNRKGERKRETHILLLYKTFKKVQLINTWHKMDSKCRIFITLFLQ